MEAASDFFPLNPDSEKDCYNLFGKPRYVLNE